MTVLMVGERSESGLRSYAICTACYFINTGAPISPDADHPVSMPGCEVFDTRDCPHCGEQGSLFLPVSRNPKAVLGAPIRGTGQGVVICTKCCAKITYGVPESRMN